MVAKKVTVTNAMGLHMRPAQLLARAVAPFDCCVEVICGGRAGRCAQHHEPDGRLCQAGG